MRDKFPNLQSLGITVKVYNDLFIATSIISAVMQFALIFWAFTLMWRTFLFRFGLMGRLFMTEFPMLFFVPLYFLLLLGEKAYRFVSSNRLTL